MGIDERDDVEDYPRNYDELMAEHAVSKKRTEPLYRRGKDPHEGVKAFHRRSAPKQVAGERKPKPPAVKVVSPEEAEQLPALAKLVSFDAHRRLRRPDNVLVMAEGKIVMHGAYHTISSKTRTEPVPIWSGLPGTEDGRHLDDVMDVRIFVQRDSEIDGWSNVVVLELTPAGERQKIRHFTDRLSGQEHVICKARLTDIQKKPKSK